MADFPNVVFISCSDVKPEEIIMLILGNSEISEQMQINNCVNAFPWVIDNKYYTAELRLCSLQKKSIISQEFSDHVEGVIIHFDSSKKFALEEVNSWLPYIHEFQPEIKILVCNNIRSDNENSIAMCRRTIQEWCISQGFELVELEPTVDVNDELEDDFQETTGVQRIIQALNAHVWPNLTMKNSHKELKPHLKSQAGSCVELNNFRKKLHLEESFDEMLEKDDDFSLLFSQLSEMKARVSNLSGSDRKAAAEQVVKAFWKALNVDNDDDDDDYDDVEDDKDDNGKNDEFFDL